MLAGGATSSFTLEFLTDTGKHAANTCQVVVVPYIELGRDRTCGIRFGEDTPTVSRRHASLERKGTRVNLLNLSATNQTLVNGRPVLREWPLNNGDEIQLSADGPRLRFISATGKAPVAFTARLQLFARQALRPYRYAVLALAALVGLSTATAAWLLYRVDADKDHLRQMAHSIEAQLTAQQRAQARGDSVALAERNRLAERLAVANQENENFQKSLAAQGKVLRALTRPAAPEPAKATVSAPPAPSAADAVVMARRTAVYALYVLLTVTDRQGKVLELAGEGGRPVRLENYLVGTGTGFVLDDGRFLTARRWVEPWAYPRDAQDVLHLYANFVHHNGGKASVRLVAAAPDGPELTLPGDQFTVPRTGDRAVVGDFGFGEGKIAVASATGDGGWATCKVPVPGAAAAPQATLGAGTRVHLLGYEIPADVQAGPAGNPTYARLTLGAADPATGYWSAGDGRPEPGNFGGPVFVLHEGKPLVAGMLVPGPDGKGRVVPIGRVK
jgi:pSer/pThr/pTyr-binding forkhead associated (FHA) protein